MAAAILSSTEIILDNSARKTFVNLKKDVSILRNIVPDVENLKDQAEPKYPAKRRRLNMQDTDLEGIHRKEIKEDFEETKKRGKLVCLDLSCSQITGDCQGWSSIEIQYLRVLSLTDCTHLLISPPFSGLSQLERLTLKRCSRLLRLDPSIGGLKKLVSLNLESCTELNMLPELGGLEALEELHIDETLVHEIPLTGSKKLETLTASNCLSLSLLPPSLEHMTSLSILSVDNSKITKLPDGVGKLVKLRHLSLRNCRWIRKLPGSIGQLGSSLEELDMSGTGISKLPDSFANLQSLRVLKMDACLIREIPGSIGRLHSLEEIIFS